MSTKMTKLEKIKLELQWKEYKRKKETVMTITKGQFERYERVRRSGVTNMFDVRRVMILAALTREQCIAIMQDYEKLFETHLGSMTAERERRRKEEA
jgi:hypothetical protein